MSLRYALLALLTAEPLTGYDAAKRFGGSVGHVWHAPDSQIYPELRRMEREGLVEGEQVRWGPNSTKTRYSITDEGVRAFREWMSTPLDYAPVRDAAHMRAAYFEWADPDSARECLQRHIDHYTEQIAQWTTVRDAILDLSNATIARRVQKYPAEDHERIIAFKAFAYDGLIGRGEAEIAWARQGLELLDKLSPRD
ncbi:MAG: PadR family transcriptional regulator [Rhodococcus sp. (in: high G+C Gram-positive bacteria)]|uniref:PadR family transcriptional regulator n=1 Tax=Rhodococcus TaxID=1827 RepID=UPI000D067743|nr:PadR family transcriptional regulator [Rhodococcus rhodochrous]AYA24295.1 PadR family transcriptional regulator [Rhodococcus rhodochrous]MCR8694655.1 PadR family transcriptional regulator [Rhodococcus pyridinivorans]